MGRTPSTKRRIKAAMVLADLDINELAGRIATRGLAARTLRKLQDENDAREPRPWELDLIAAACDVPAWFLQDDWAASTTSPGLDQRIGRLEQQVSELVTRFAADAPPSPPDELLRPPEDAPTSARSSSHEPTRRDTGSRRDTGR
jgi:hypothetical protein